MRKRHTVPLTVKGIVKMVNTKEISFDYPVQRAYNQWGHLQQSLIIHSVLTDFDVPSVYAVQAKDESKSVYSIIDGKQRLSVLADFMNNKFALHKDTPVVIFEEKEYDISQSTYEELPEALQDTFRDYNLDMVYFINITDEEIFEMFFRLNNGTPLSPQQKAKSKMTINIAEYLKEICVTNFISSKLNLTDNQRKKADDELIIEQAMMLLDEDYKIGKFNSKDATLYAETLKDKNELFLSKVRSIIEFLNEVYKEEDGGIELKKVNAPMLIATASKAVEEKLEPKRFYKFILTLREYIEDGNSEYAQYIGDSTTNKGKVEGRYNLMQKYYEKYFTLIDASAN